MTILLQYNVWPSAIDTKVTSPVILEGNHGQCCISVLCVYSFA